MTIRDKVRGSLIAGAAGDALGYPVEFLRWSDICDLYGEKGITAYSIFKGEEKAVITDDTQMTMFTAAGLLKAALDKQDDVTEAVHEAYFDWLNTQDAGFDASKSTWLSKIPQLYRQRAPGNTCLSALYSRVKGTPEKAVNMSKGCGGIMRVAPVGLFLRDIEQVNILAAEAAALTHGHPLGWLSAAAFAHIVNRLLYGECAFGDTFEDIVAESIDTLQMLWPDVQEVEELAEGMQTACVLAKNDAPDRQNIALLGEGWVGEETLYIAVYCTARYKTDLTAALIAAVNHNGDSDSTGAVTGNMVGAMLGYENIPAYWLNELELREELLQLADDLICEDKNAPELRARYGVRE